MSSSSADGGWGQSDAFQILHPLMVEMRQEQKRRKRIRCKWEDDCLVRDIVWTTANWQSVVVAVIAFCHAFARLLLLFSLLFSLWRVCVNTYKERSECRIDCHLCHTARQRREYWMGTQFRSRMPRWRLTHVHRWLEIVFINYDIVNRLRTNERTKGRNLSLQLTFHFNSINRRTRVNPMM